MVDLSNKAFCVFGLRGSGKSYFMHYLAARVGAKCLVFDTLGEIKGDITFDVISPANRYNAGELEVICRWVMAGAGGRKYTMFCIDEANRFCPPKPTPLPQAVADLNDWQRHERITTGYIARRPVQLNQDLIELAEYLFVFNLKGKSDVGYLESISAGLGEAVFSLAPWHFVCVDPNRNYTVYPPV